MLKKIFAFSFITFFSRVLGLVRDALVAYHLGAQGLSDVFLAAFRLPNLFRAYFAEGSLSVSFVPQYSQKLSDPQEAQGFANQIFSLLFWFLTLFCLSLAIFTPQVLGTFAPGFLGSSYKFGLSVELTRIMLPYLLFVSLMSVIGGILQTHQCFYVTAAAPVILNSCIIISALLPHWFSPVYYFSVAVSTAAIIQFCLSVFIATRKKLSVKLVIPRRNKDMKIFAKRSCMSFFSGCMQQISIWINTIFASYIPGAISYFYYADRVNQLPQALVGISMSIVLMPTIAKLARSGDTCQMIEKQNSALDLGMTLIIPSAAILIASPEPVLMALLNYGQFDYWAIGNTVPVLAALAVSLPAFVISKILLLFFYARGEFTIPALFSVMSLGANALCAYLLMKVYGHIGIAIGGTIGTWSNAMLLLLYLKVNNLYAGCEALRIKLGYVFLSATSMVAVLIMGKTLLEPYFFLGPVVKIPVLILLMVAGISVYLGTLCVIFKQKVSIGDM
ncbi:integral membrane protein MviN [Anaplasma phagocytophilum str. ApMUC09]|uniref:Probable lipid II flippase MurJ n=1 Tax=Anaplasma phagocytophilum str. ApMUC09 TaxID=1359152 RepID=A0A0F3N7V7_ANAPH|nr:integral membrane protein MviN [Anaplasma phagocytophilum str. ApMUC09]